MKYIIDRFEGNYAICEDEHGNMVNINRDKLPSNAAEGDVVVRRLTGYIIDQSETNKRKKGNQSLMKELWKD